MIRRLSSLILSLLFLASAALAGPNGAGLSINGALGTGGQLLGTVTSDNACAGCVGEYISSTILVGSAVSMSTGAAVDVTSISLTPGDWMVTGVVVTNPGGGTTQTDFLGWISTVSATLPTRPNSGAFARQPFAALAGTDISMPVGTMRLSLAATTTVYLSGRSVFAVSTDAIYGFIGARRTR